MTEQHEPAHDDSADEAAASSPGQEISAGVVDVDTLPGGLAAGIEAVLMVAERPVSEFDLAEVLGQSVDEIRATLDSLRAEYDGLTGNDDDPVVPRGFELRKVALSGVSGTFAAWVRFKLYYWSGSAWTEITAAQFHDTTTYVKAAGTTGSRS